jgi:hypothetical protein
MHLSATPYTGGVAESLRSQVPLRRDVGLVVDWELIAADDALFAVTKAIHNGLQGDGFVPPLQPIALDAAMPREVREHVEVGSWRTARSSSAETRSR